MPKKSQKKSNPKATLPEQLPIPPDAIKDLNSVEMIRGWIANERLQISLKIGMWTELGFDEPKAWGLLLSDSIRHIANALHDLDGRDHGNTMRTIKRELDAEIDEPTTTHRGQFVEPQNEDVSD